jgi:uncharacterized membrane protein YgdD (TMEM256/DUF423 family)
MKSIKHQNIAICGATLCLLAVTIGAFGAHALKDILVENQRESVFDLANRYQFYHGLALLLIAALFQNSEALKSLKLIANLMVTGVLIFSISLYALAISNASWLGAITPIGGTLMLLAWGLTIWRLLKAQ